MPTDPGRRRRFGRYYAWVSPAMDAGGGCHTGRDTVAAIAAAGFTLGAVEEFRFPDVRLSMPASPHLRAEAVSGTARDRQDRPAP